MGDLGMIKGGCLPGCSADEEELVVGEVVGLLVYVGGSGSTGK